MVIRGVILSAVWAGVAVAAPVSRPATPAAEDGRGASLARAGAADFLAAPQATPRAALVNDGDGGEGGRGRRWRGHYGYPAPYYYAPAPRYYAPPPPRAYYYAPPPPPVYGYMPPPRTYYAPPPPRGFGIWINPGF